MSKARDLTADEKKYVRTGACPICGCREWKTSLPPWCGACGWRPSTEAALERGRRRTSEPPMVCRGGGQVSGREAYRGLKPESLDGLDWKPVPDPDPTAHPDVPRATHKAVLRLGVFGSVRVYQLDDGTRVFDADDVAAFFASDE